MPWMTPEPKQSDERALIKCLSKPKLFLNVCGYGLETHSYACIIRNESCWIQLGDILPVRVLRRIVV